MYIMLNHGLSWNALEHLKDADSINLLLMSTLSRAMPFMFIVR